MSEERSYSVGYGKTPAHTRYKKGQSGNPSGKAKPKPENGKGLIEQALRQQVEFTTNGKRRRISLAEAMVRKHVHQAANGNIRSVAEILRLRKVFSEHSSARPVTIKYYDEPGVT